ncbi:MAG TPA: SDR family oxidoreductase [Acidobacteriaceae bacterium]|jgi:NAD(P)-dependent dehydrogenase (short-subunit alcohol dehydrogenase family)|nr:SDR family oxidoreductase [Acidobacteriaceae bacterium]
MTTFAESNTSSLARFANPFFLAGFATGIAETAFDVAGTALSTARALRPTQIPEGAVVLVTGGSRGLGLAIANRFAHNNIRLVLAARDLSELQSAQQQILAQQSHRRPEDFHLVAADLTNPADCRRLIDETFARFGRLDILIHNAGVIEVGPAELQPTEAFERAMQLHLFAAIHTTWAALPRLYQQEPLPGWRRRAAIVNIASIGGKIAVPHLLPYTASKFALVGFSEGLHAELRRHKIRVTTVCPGLMRTGGEEHAQFLGDQKAEALWFKLCAKTPGIATTPEHAADRIYRAVLHGCSEITITPQAWLAARFAGLCPNTTQLLNAFVNDYILPRA